jgi:hypothetical protein
MIVERRFQHLLNGLIISGKPDRVNTVDNIVEDYKVTNVWALIDERKLDDWRLQLSLYKWLLFKNGIHVEKGVVHSILRDFTKRMLYNSDMPDVPFRSKTIDLLDLEETEEWVKARIEWFSDVISDYIEHFGLPATEYLPVCSPSDRWRKDTTYAVMKEGRKSAVKLFLKEQEAEERVRQEQERNPKAKYRVEVRPGEDVRCISYCSVCEYCPYWRSMYGPEHETVDPDDVFEELPPPMYEEEEQEEEEE